MEDLYTDKIFVNKSGSKMIVFCDCEDLDHQMMISCWKCVGFDDIPVIAFDYRLTRWDSVFKRIKVALRYIWGKDLQYDERLLSYPTVKEMRDFLSDHLDHLIAERKT